MLLKFKKSSYKFSFVENKNTAKKIQSFLNRLKGVKSVKITFVPKSVFTDVAPNSYKIEIKTDFNLREHTIRFLDNTVRSKLREQFKDVVFSNFSHFDDLGVNEGYLIFYCKK